MNNKRMIIIALAILIQQAIPTIKPQTVTKTVKSNRYLYNKKTQINKNFTKIKYFLNTLSN